MRMNRANTVIMVFLIVLTWVGYLGCTTTPSETTTLPSPTQKALIGKTKAELLACTTGQPEERRVGDLTVLKYYKEASQFEESFSGTKSSVARLHHGCWATLGLKNDRVEAIQYNPVPSSYKGDDHCDEIFEHCVGP